MTPGSLGISGSLLVLLTFASPIGLRAEPLLAYGVTNVAIGDAELNFYDYGAYTVNSLRSNGVDGVSIHVGEPDSGVFFSPSTSYLEDGNYMVAKTYGQLNGTNNALLATIQGGRASRAVYPLSLDYSALAPQSVTYQIFYGRTLVREFTRGTPMVVVDYGSWGYPTVNPLTYRSGDGAFGTMLTMSQPVQFVFPELLTSAFGDQLFIRLNNPANPPGPLSRLDILGGGRLSDFTFNDIALGIFGRPHQALYGVRLQARSNWLRVDNFVNTNYLPGVLIKTEPVGALNLQCEPLQLGESNAVLLATATGTSAGDPYSTLGTLRLDRLETEVVIGFEQGRTGEQAVQVLINGEIAQTSGFVEPFTISVPTNARIGSITAHARTLENLPGYHVQFAEPVPVTLRSNLVVTGDELRIVMPYPARMENLLNLFVSGKGFGALTITNEITTSPAGPARLEIARGPDSVVIKWADPNRLLSLGYSVYGGLDGPYFGVTNETIFNDPYKTVTIPVLHTNFTFFRLFYYPTD